MTKVEMKYLLKRYRFLAEAIRKGKSTAFFQIGKKKERVLIDDEIIKFSNAVEKALEKEKNDYSREMLSRLVCDGWTDVQIFTKSYTSRSTYYSAKSAFLTRLFCLCALAGLVSEDDLT